MLQIFSLSPLPKETFSELESLAFQFAHANPRSLSLSQNYNAFNIRGQDLILKNEQLNYKQIEALEEILKRIQFRLIDLENCNLDEDVSCLSKDLSKNL